ncbi:heterokaryon incompatibility protein-domain-containing protein [Pyrenochaeta sp. MPI-SDFR-AT-0127]|nr:heterokaryon incompatibility protein-domain-containing protein [Pyrenochaeta sp. MPI-SDFR-AT-0127]
MHLQVIKRSDDRYYEAVSYAWGTNDATIPLLIHDEQHASLHLHDQNLLTRAYRYKFLTEQTQAVLPVRLNVALMLRHLRYPWLPRHLWIDQLCINQQDKEEKSRQVNQMGEIYRRSGRTLIWLGCSKNQSRPLSALQTASYESREEEDGIYYTRLKPEVRRLLSLPWFQRRWVIQEAALASRPRVIYGFDEMSFEDMTYFIDQLRKISFDIPPHIAESIHVLETITSLFRRTHFRGAGFMTNVMHDVYQQYYRHHPKSNGTADFIQLLISMNTAQCSDDRDRLYALNSLRCDPMNVDYQKTTEEVYSTFAITECTQSLETLYCCGAFPSQNLPSWVPDWRSPRQWIPIKCFEGRPPSHQLLSDSLRNPNLASRKPYFINTKTMVVNAVIFTFVVSKGPQLYENWTFNPWLCLSKYLNYYKRTAGSGSPKKSAHDAQYLDRLVCTLTAGAIRSGENLGQWFEAYSSASSYKRARKEYVDACCDCKDVSFCAYPAVHSNNFNILERVEQILKGRCTFVTDSGHWAVGPASLLSGDLVVALPGCSYPFAMRPKGPATFTIVGDCYLALPRDLDTFYNQSTSRPISIV